MTDEPREAEDELKVTKRHDMGGKGLRVCAMNAKRGCEIVSDGPSRGLAAIYEFERDGLDVLQGRQLMLNQDGGVEEAVRGAGVDKGFNRDGRLARYENMDQESKVARKRGRERGGRNGATQPGSYWLGESFFGT